MSDNFIKRTFKIRIDYLDCKNCSLNYKAGEPVRVTGFCQEHCMVLDENDNFAGRCNYFHPVGASRTGIHVDAPENERWYEKDSMG